MTNKLSNSGGIHVTYLRSITTAIAVLILATPLIAQTSAQAATVRDTAAVGHSSELVSPTPSASLVVQNLSTSAVPAWVNAVPVSHATSPSSASARAMESGATSQNTAMMLIGGAGIIVGAVVGGKAGTVVMIGGTVVGLVGLWNYLK
jgi:hypothetical protein